jgi:hypothetical protein
MDIYIYFPPKDKRFGNTFPIWTQHFSTYVVSTNVASLGTTYDVPLRDDCNIFWYRSPGSSTSFKNLGLPSFPGFIPERHKHRPFQTLTLSPPFLRLTLPSPQTVNTITFPPSIHAHSVPTLKTLLFFFFFRSPCPNCSPADRAFVPPSCSLFPRVFFFYPEDEGRTCLRKIGRFLSDYSGPCHRSRKSSCNADNKHSTTKYLTK